MPEGDTIFRAARTLTRALAGKSIARASSSLPELANAKLSGHRVEAIEAHGKNLVVRFDDGRALHTHMRMNGAWHLYRAGEPWRKAEHLARIVLEVDAANGDPPLVAVCFSAPVVRLLRAGELDTDVKLASLGPDVLAADFDAPEAIRRLRALGAMPLGEAIVHQNAIAGVGNVYKSEVLFARRLDPFAAVASFDDETLLALVNDARRMMLRNVANGGGMRTTMTSRHLHGSRFAVYDRSGQRCFVCGEIVRMRRQGSLNRSTYYCARCQKIAG